MRVSELRDRVHAYLRDRKAENRILGEEEEYSLEDIINAANMALEEINHRHIIITNYTIDNCDPYLLRLGTTKHLLLGRIAAKARNYVTVNDGGVSVNREGNIDLYQRIYESIRAEFDAHLEMFKNNLNLRRGYGH